MLDDKAKIKQQADDLLSREVNRAEFIRYIGVALLSVIGINSFIKYLHDNVGNKQNTKRGYGGGAYGQ